jgi:glutamine---fructose-6-phosphate transaminase (isomerizing)
MCGIIGYIGTQNPTELLLRGLKQLEYRGYDSAGIAVISPKNVDIIRSTGHVANLENKVKSRKILGTTGMGHTRWATHGEVSESNSHPHQAGWITLVHNGIIENYAELKNHILQEHRTLQSETDSEIVAHLLDMELQQGTTLTSALTRILPQLKGSSAFVINDARDPDTLVGVSNGIPLWVGPKGQEIYLSSDSRGLAPFTEQGYFLKTGEIVQCRRGGFDLLDFTGKRIHQTLSFVPLSYESTELSGFEHYMHKEIFEQPGAILRTLSSQLNQNTLEHLPWETWDHVLLVGCGSARHAGLVSQKFLEEKVRVPVTVEYGSEFRESINCISKSSLVICISQSGETADTLTALREAKKRGFSTLCITNVKESTLAREAQYALFTEAGGEVSVASTKAFTSQVSLLLQLSLRWAQTKCPAFEGDYRYYEETLLNLPELIAQTLQRERQLRQLCPRVSESSHFFFLGKGVLYPVALECALKLKEISYSFAEAYPAGELKHGPLALIDKRSTVVLLAPGQSANPNWVSHEGVGAQEKMMSTLREVKSRGATIWTWGSENDFFKRESHFFTSLPSSNRLAEPILFSCLGQLFAYHFAKLKGCEIDMPRNLAKSVTVE